LSRATLSCCRQRLTITAINYSGRASELGGIVNLVDRRRSSLSRCERPRCRAKLIIDMPWRNRAFAAKVQREVYLFWRYSNFLITRWVEGSSLAKTQPDSFMRFNRAPTRGRQTDRHRHGAIDRTRASIPAVNGLVFFPSPASCLLVGGAFRRLSASVYPAGCRRYRRQETEYGRSTP